MSRSIEQKSEDCESIYLCPHYEAPKIFYKSDGLTAFEIILDRYTALVCQVGHTATKNNPSNTQLNLQQQFCVHLKRVMMILASILHFHAMPFQTYLSDWLATCREGFDSIIIEMQVMPWHDVNPMNREIFWMRTFWGCTDCKKVLAFYFVLVLIGIIF